MDENIIEMVNKIIDDSRQFIEQANEVNKKFVHAFVTCVAIVVVVMSILIGFIVVMYFTSSYDYGIISQYQDGGQDQSVSIGYGS